MNSLKWLLITTGMLTLFVALNIQLWTTVTGRLETVEDLVVWMYIIGGFVLVVPPLIEHQSTEDPAQRSFPALLIVLQIFLLFSGAMHFVESLWWKIPIRIGASIVVTAFLKYQLQALPDFHWNFLFNPVNFLRYHADVLRGRYSAAYALSLGVDWLGVGYAFLQYPAGKLFVFLGGLFLFVSAVRDYRASKKPISLAWGWLNGAYTAYGLAFFVFALRSLNV